MSAKRFYFAVFFMQVPLFLILSLTLVAGKQAAVLALFRHLFNNYDKNISASFGN